MEELFVSAILIYTLISCGCFLLTFFRARKHPYRFLVIGSWTMCAHIVYKLIWIVAADKGQYELPVPFGLAYSMLLYLFAHAYYQMKTVSRWQMLCFSSPFCLHLVLFVIAWLRPQESGWAIGYSSVYYASCILSLLVYATMTVRLYSRSKRPPTPTDVLIRQLTLLYFGLVVLTYLVLYELHAGGSGMGFEVRPMVFLFLAIGFALVLKYRLTRGVPIVDVKARLIDEDNAGLADATVSELPSGLVQHMADVIDKELIQSKLFLNPAVSLDMLSQRTSIPRHQLTQVFNRYYKKAFYSFIAAARTEYAITRIPEMGDTITLDSLSYECGFNSKTSFNRYFKEYTGMTPSEYRSIANQMLHIQQ
ncbi:helix-turn-helix domain-containing protein [Parapedobacter deserti]|uniref:Helix-turn-helix domain-containing protein n=1 Tax=Parapedobacter deserti TaxID=1912957 RepID=A0ABV7JIQ0_9SPHI